MMFTAPVIFGKSEVQATPELRRIATLPRRTWTQEETAKVQDILTEELRTSTGTMRLNAVQAQALYEVLMTGGLFGPIKVGGGKTLLTLLIPTVLEAKRPVLLLPAALIEKTKHEREILSRHWKLPTNLQIISYEMMGRVSYAEQLNYIQPDLIDADEVHRLKNHRAGVTRRVARYMKERPETRFAGVSGTVMKNSLKDFDHILRWALKDGAPIPKTSDEVTAWAEALDEKVNPIARRRPGAIFMLGPKPQADDALSAARQIFQRRLLDTPGVIASGRDDAAGSSLLIEAIEYDVSEVTDEHFKNIKATWTTPDGYAFSEAIELWRHCRTLALGFHGIWDPRPPQEWLDARRGWARYVRETLANSRTLDTELQVAQHVSSAQTRPGWPLLQAWRDVRDTFTANPRPVWHDDSALKVCEEWMNGHKGIVWCEHVFFAAELSKRTGAPYYGADGLAKDGVSIVDVKPGHPIICSIQANSTGRNLQMFSENLVTSPPPGAAGWEQLLGRTHRFGQEADTVTVDILLGCKEHHDAVMRALDAARASADTMGHDQKLLLADLVFPTTIANKRGARWQ